MKNNKNVNLKKNIWISNFSSKSTKYRNIDDAFIFAKPIKEKKIIPKKIPNSFYTQNKN